jgi:hypothetical protein
LLVRVYGSRRVGVRWARDEVVGGRERQFSDRDSHSWMQVRFRHPCRWSCKRADGSGDGLESRRSCHIRATGCRLRPRCRGGEQRPVRVRPELCANLVKLVSSCSAASAAGGRCGFAWFWLLCCICCARRVVLLWGCHLGGSFASWGCWRGDVVAKWFLALRAETHGTMHGAD